jgi:hypothetical protein
MIAPLTPQNIRRGKKKWIKKKAERIGQSDYPPRFVMESIMAKLMCMRCFF